MAPRRKASSDASSGLYPHEGQAAALLEAELVLATPDEKLRAVGLSYAKIAGIKDLAQKTIDGVVPPYEILHTLGNDEIVERLTQVRGIGRWTVEMLLMFRLGRPDVLPVDDFGVRNGFRLAYGLRGMPTARALAEFGARWAPFRSVAAWYLWRAVDLHRAGKLPAPALATRIKLVKKQPEERQRARRKRSTSGKHARVARISDQQENLVLFRLHRPRPIGAAFHVVADAEQVVRQSRRLRTACGRHVALRGR